MSAPMTDLEEMLGCLDVVVRPGSFVFQSVEPGSPLVGQAQAFVVEAEALTVVVTPAAARRQGLEPGAEFAWLTLTLNSSLEAVGLTAAFSTALGRAGISCNVLAGFHHDHLLVPLADREHAVIVLRDLGDQSH